MERTADPPVSAGEDMLERSHSSSRRPARHLLLAGALLGVLLAGDACSCDEPLVQIPDDLPDQCNLTDPGCGDREAYRNGQCVAAGCESDADCCPGSRCRLDFNSCWPRQLDPEYSCETDADCPDPAQRCQPTSIGGRDPLAVCVYERCEGDSDCGVGRSCFHSVCVKTTPCGGGCPEGEVCDVLTSTCSPVPEGAFNCDASCGEAGLKVLTDPDTMSGDQCCSAQCVCRGLPPIVPTNFGKYAGLAKSDSELLVSAYDLEYGDLVLAHYKQDGSFSRVEYVDGIPVGGVPVADRNGPRGGIADPGPNVGTHTSIALDSFGRARIAYHDVDNGALKIALFGANGWSTHTIDTAGGEGNVGQYTDIAVNPASGQIVISYLALDVSGAPGISGLASAVKIARSRVPEPTSASDWEISFVDARPAFDPCNGSCASGEVCVLDGTAATCFPTATTCADPCQSSQHCVQTGAGAECRADYLPPAHPGFPRARGLHTKLLLDGALSYVAYHDSIDGEVRLARVNADGSAQTYVIDGDGQDGRRGGSKVGRWPSVAKLSGNELMVVYEDFSRHAVRAWQGVPGAAGVYSTVDAGKIPNQAGSQFVGASTAVSTVDGSEPLVIYQDASSMDLKLATRGDDGAWTVQTLLSEGAHGFYTDLQVSGGAAIISSVVAELDGRGHEASRVGLTIRNLP